MLLVSPEILGSNAVVTCVAVPCDSVFHRIFSLFVGLRSLSAHPVLAVSIIDRLMFLTSCALGALTSPHKLVRRQVIHQSGPRRPWMQAKRLDPLRL